MSNVLKDAAGIQPELKDIIIMPTQAASAATDVAGLKTDLNSLIAKLKAAGLMLG